MKEDVAARLNSNSNGNGKPRRKQKLPTPWQMDHWNATTGCPDDPAEEAETRPEFEIVRASDVKPVEIRYRWPGRIPVGKLTLIAGPPGDGKTMTFCGYYPAVRTTGKEWADGAASSPAGDVLIVSSEDGIEDTLVPRLIAHGANLNRVHFLKSVLVPSSEGKGHKRALQLNVLRDEDEFCAFAKEKYPKLTDIIADPITEIAGQFKSNDNVETRLAMAPAVRIAERLDVAFVGLTHFSKSVIGSALMRCIGSTAFVAVARVVWCIVRDKEDPQKRLLLPLKCNIGPQPSGLSFRIVEPGRIEWEGATSVSADEAVGDTKAHPAKKLDAAKSWLVKRLASGAVRSVELFVEADHAGHSERTVWRARKDLQSDITTEKVRGEDGVFMWSLKSSDGGDWE